MFSFEMFLMYFSRVVFVTDSFSGISVSSFSVLGSVSFCFLFEILFDPPVVLLTHVRDTLVLFTFFILCGITLL